MAFRILQDDNLAAVAVHTHRLNPAAAEIDVVFTLEQPAANVELRGRLVGPRNQHASTVEVAYHLRRLPHSQEQSPLVVTGRVIVPEPSFWEPEAPCLYEGPLELWSNGKPLVRLQVSHGLRAFQLTAQGLRWNGKPLTMRGFCVQQLSEAEAAFLHQHRYNTLVVPRVAQFDEVCAVADRFGFLVFGYPRSLGALAGHLDFQAGHASWLGWIVDQAALTDREYLNSISHLEYTGQLLAVSVQGPLPEQPLPGRTILLCREELLPVLGEVPCPWLIWTRDKDRKEDHPLAATAAGFVVG